MLQQLENFPKAIELIKFQKFVSEKRKSLWFIEDLEKKDSTVELICSYCVKSDAVILGNVCTFCKHL